MFSSPKHVNWTRDDLERRVWGLKSRIRMLIFWKKEWRKKLYLIKNPALQLACRKRISSSTSKPAPHGTARKLPTANMP